MILRVLAWVTGRMLAETGATGEGRKVGTGERVW